MCVVRFKFVFGSQKETHLFHSELYHCSSVVLLWPVVSFQGQTTHVQYLNWAGGQQLHPELISVATARRADRLSHCSARQTRVALEQCKRREGEGDRREEGWETVKGEKEQRERLKGNYGAGGGGRWESWGKDRKTITTVIVVFREGSACFTVWGEGPFYSFWFTLCAGESINSVWVGGRVQQRSS